MNEALAIAYFVIGAVLFGYCVAKGDLSGENDGCIGCVICFLWPLALGAALGAAIARKYGSRSDATAKAQPSNQPTPVEITKGEEV